MKITGMNTKYVFFTIMLIVVSAVAKMNSLNDFPFLKNTVNMINIISPEELNILRVRNLDKFETMNNMTKILDFIGLVERHGYPAEEHYVTTEDGYNLTIHRIPGSPQSNSLYNQQKKKVVFVAHGIICSSDNWVLFGPGKGLGFVLADQGYDVWLGNFRGNTYSRSHIKMSPKNPDFWKFSYHEMGTKDLPAMIDYVFNYTKSNTLDYIGYSMGTTTLFVLLSVKPEYNNKIRLGICLAPIGFLRDLSPVLRNVIAAAPIKGFLEMNELYELFPLSSAFITLASVLCANDATTHIICATLFSLITGPDPSQLNTTVLPEIFSQFPCGASMQTAYHYLQLHVTDKFQSYDYGRDGNYEQYKQATPIKYYFKKITTPIALFYSANDWMVTKPNVLRLYKELSNVILLEENPYKFFNHVDFMWAIDVKTLLYDRVIEVMQKFNDKLDSQ